MLIFRALPFVAGAVLVVAVVYYAGKHMGLWRGFGASRKPAAKPQVVESPTPARPAHEALMEDIRHAVLGQYHDTWLQAVRNDLMLYVYTMAEGDVETVYIDTISSDDFINRIAQDKVAIRVWWYKRGDPTDRMKVRTVRVDVIKPDRADEHSSYDLQRGAEVAEGSAAVLATDDELRRMKANLRLAGRF